MNKLHILSCLDSDDLADRRRRELGISPDVAADLGLAAVKAADQGFYVSGTGRKVDWRAAVQTCRRKKQSIAPDSTLPMKKLNPSFHTRAQVANETTLGASQRLVESGLRPLALNFANGLVPGGAFLAGARAQEEVLCRSSALFQTLVDDPMYDEHRRHESMASTDWAILSPEVPVFRKDDGTPLESPWKLDFVTCAAPYVPDVGQPLSGDLLHRRIHRLLAIASAYNYSALVLGAWGCGAFENDPHRTASSFRSVLEAGFPGAFSDVVFAITDWSQERRTLGPFRDVFRSNDQ